MSTTCFAIYLAVLSTFTFTHGLIYLDFRQEDISKLRKVHNADKSNHSKVFEDRTDYSVNRTRSFLAGEDTPVWVAYYADPNNTVLLTYDKLKKGIVKQAIDYWKSNKVNGLYIGKRSVDDNRNPFKGDRKSFVEGEDIYSVRPLVSRIPERLQWKTNGRVYHPSVLAVMEYGNTWPSDKKAERNLILDRIIYALAYWNSINIQLRPIEDPWVRLRLAGIVIGRHRDATHHLFEAYGDKQYLHYERTLQPMAEYWGDKMRRNVDFQRHTYNIVALMTDAKQVPDKEVVAVSTNGLPCNRNNPNETGVLITYDNLKFSGLQETLRFTARILGHGSDKHSACVYRNHWKNREWGACDLDSIRTNLDSNGWCMKDPKEFHNPGKPVKIILPGSFLSWRDQCKAIGPHVGYICPDSNCNELRCEAKDFAGYPCVSWQPLLDGSTCGKGKVCLNGECVLHRFVTHAYIDSPLSSNCVCF